MSLISLADQLYRLSRQLNLLVRPTIKIVNPIPRRLLPRLLQLSLGEGSGSTMEHAISLVEGNKKSAKNFTAVLAYIDDNIIGWSLVKLDPRNTSGDIDIFVDPKYRRHDVGAQLKFEATKYIESQKHTPGQYDHFAPYKEDGPDDVVLRQQMEKTHQLLRSLHFKKKLCKNKKELASIDEEIRQAEFIMKDMLEDERTQPTPNPSQLLLVD